MKMAWLFIFLVFFISGCSRTNAFVHFERLDNEQERAVVQLHQLKLTDEQNLTTAYASVVYLNPVTPQLDNGTEQFMVALLDRRKQPISAYAFRLQGHAPTLVEPLKKSHELRRLMPLNNAWNRYYRLEFASIEDQNLTLSLGEERVIYARH